MKHLLNMVLLGSFRLAKTAIICQSTTSVADAIKKLRVKMHYTVIKKKYGGWALKSNDHYYPIESVEILQSVIFYAAMFLTQTVTRRG